MMSARLVVLCYPHFLSHFTRHRLDGSSSMCQKTKSVSTLANIGVQSTKENLHPESEPVRNHIGSQLYYVYITMFFLWNKLKARSGHTELAYCFPFCQSSPQALPYRSHKFSHEIDNNTRISSRTQLK